VFSAHGVPKSVFADAKSRNMFYLDATCPLVTKVHVDAERHAKAGRQVILIGHAGHPEVVGTMGQLPEARMLLVENKDQAEKVAVDDPRNLAYVTQTTLSVDDTAAIVEILKRRFPQIEDPRKEDICYATTNRQASVKAIARDCDALIVIGAPNSSNSNRLAEVARVAGCPKSILIQRAADLDLAWLDGVRRLGITAGASAPEVLVQELIAACRKERDVTVEEVNILEENVEFSLPRVLTA
jgi:4-hydroxy-3-methylbut-2-enyl diphosphate reductase